MIGQPLSYYADNKHNLKFYLIDVGEGLMTLIIFPNDKVLLFDCNVTEDNHENVIEYMKSVIPFNVNPENGEKQQLIHVFVNSHRDEDHYRGLKIINDTFPIISIWDSGQSGENTDSENYAYYMRLRRSRKEKDEKFYKELVPSDIPVDNVAGATIVCMAAEEDYAEGFSNGTTALSRSKEKKQHTNCIVMQIIYGGTKILLTGDSDWKSWKDGIIPNFKDVVNSEILIASHHGSRSFFTSEETIDEKNYPDTTYIESIMHINPDIVLIPCGKYKTNHHPNIDAERIYLEYAKNEQVYTTNVWGTFEGVVKEDGSYTVVPSFFRDRNHSSPNVQMSISCEYHKDKKVENVENNSYLPIGGTLKFRVKTKGNVTEPLDQVKAYWKVSNGGIGKDSNHQEIYSKGNNEKQDIFQFERELSYVGKHLLYVRINNKRKGIRISKVFVVNGEEKK